MQHDTPSKLSGNTVALHWIVAIMMLSLLAAGVYMVEYEVHALYPWHKSFGVLIVLFVILRVLWRLKNGWPPAVRDYTRLEKTLSRFVHYLLIIGTVIMPISGFMMSALGGYGVALFGLELVARNPDPANPEEVIAHNEVIAGIAHKLHFIAGYTIIVGVVLHIVGALKHHVMDKDGTLRRMLGAKV